MKTNQLEKSILQIIEECSFLVGDITLDTPFEEMEIDNVHKEEIDCYIKDELGIIMPNKTSKKFKTPRDYINWISYNSKDYKR